MLPIYWHFSDQAISLHSLDPMRITITWKNGSTVQAECRSKFITVPKEKLACYLRTEAYPIIHRQAGGAFSVSFHTRGLGGGGVCCKPAENQRPLLPKRKAPAPAANAAEPPQTLADRLCAMAESYAKAFSEYDNICVPMVAKKNEDEIDLEHDIHQFLSSEQTVYLIKGDAGSGKSFFLEQLAANLGRKYRPFQSIPLFISLPRLKDPIHRCINETLEQYGFTKEEIAYIRAHGSFILILDAYDEIHTDQNLFATNNLDQLRYKAVISCRSQYLPPNYLGLFAPSVGNRPRPALLREATIAPFSYAQIAAYIKKRVSQGNTPWKSCEECLDLIETIPGLILLVQNPFILTIVIQALPQVLEIYGKLASDEFIRLTRYELYRIFIQQWFDRQQNKLSASGRISKDVDMRPRFEEFSRRLAQKMHEERVYAVVYDEAAGLFDAEQSPWEPFFRPETALVRSGCPLKIMGNQWSFVHGTVLEFFVSDKLFNAMQNLSPAMQPHESRAVVSKVLDNLNQRLIVNERQIIQFSADRARSDKLFRKALFEIVNLSKTTDGVHIAAANAITILNAARIPFSRLNLSGVRIPDADLSKAILDHTCFANADLQRVRLEDAFMRKTVFKQARMAGIRLGQKPVLMVGSAALQIALSPDNQWIAVGTRTGVEIFERATFKHFKSLNCGWKDIKKQKMEFSSDGRLLLAAATEQERPRAPLVIIDCTSWEIRKSPLGQVYPGGFFVFINSQQIFTVIWHVEPNVFKCSGIWDLASGQLVKAIDKKALPIQDIFDASEFTLSPSKNLLCLKGALYTIPDCKKVTELPELYSLDPPFPEQCPFSADGRYVAYISRNDKPVVAKRHLCIYDIKSMQVIHRTETLIWGCLAISPDGARIAGNGEGGRLHIYDWKEQQIVATLHPHLERVHKLSFSEDGQLLFSASADKTVRITELDRVHSLDSSSQGTVTNAEVSPERNLIAVFDNVSNKGQIRIINATTGEVQFLWSSGRRLRSLQFFHSSDFLAAWEYVDKRTVNLVIFDTARSLAQKSKTQFNHWGNISTDALSRDGRLLATQGVKLHRERPDAPQTATTIIRILSLPQGDILHEIPINFDYVLGTLSFSPQGEFLAIGCNGNKHTGDAGLLLVYNIRTGGQAEQVPGFCPFRGGFHETLVLFSNDSQFFIFANNENEICHYNIRAKKIEKRWKTHQLRISTLALSKNGRLLASGDSSGTICLWDAENGECMTSFAGHGSWVERVHFTENDTNLISLTKDYILWCWSLYLPSGRLEPCLQWASASKFSSKEVELTDAHGLTHESERVLSPSRIASERKFED